MAIRLAPLLLALSLTSVQPGRTQPHASGPRSAALGGAQAADSGTQYGLGNPASSLSSPEIAFSVAVARSYGLSELDHVLSTVQIGTRSASFGLTVESFGFEDYRRLTGHALLACPLGAAGTDVGLRISYSRLAVAGYGSTVRAWLSAGARVRVVTGVLVGAYVRSLVRSRSDAIEGIRSVAVGIRLAPNKHVAFIADIEAVERHVPGLRAGIELEVLDQVAVRGGFSTLPATFSFGLGIRLSGLEADFGSSRHQPLGWSRSVGMVVRH